MVRRGNPAHGDSCFDNFDQRRVEEESYEKLPL